MSNEEIKLPPTEHIIEMSDGCGVFKRLMGYTADEVRTLIAAALATRPVADAGDYVPEYKTLTDHNGKVTGVQWVNADKAPPVGSRAAPAARTLELLREARAALETWKDVAPAVSLCADIDKHLGGE